jgi:hypothetical protein
LKQHLTIVIVFILLYSCGSESKPASFETISIDTTYEAHISATYDKAEGRSDLSENINTNVEKAIVSALSSAESKITIQTLLKNFNSEYVNFKKDFPEASEPDWELNIETELTYQSYDIITIAISSYEFKGGAHGNDKIKFLNLNAQTGAVLNQNELIKNKTGFKALAEKYFEQSLEIEKNHLTMEDFFYGKPFQLPENIGFSADGLVFLYTAYEVASYNQGYTEFVIPFEEVAQFLNVN